MKLNEITSTECIMCGKKYDKPGFLFCTRCYQEVKNNKINIDATTKTIKISSQNDENRLFLLEDENKTLIKQIETLKNEINDKNKEIEKLQIKQDNENMQSLPCDDGHLVKSKSEMLIDNYLYSHGILHAYEQKFGTGRPEPKFIKPDFFLPGKNKEEDIYIEHWGYDKKENYLKQKEFKIGIYNEKKVTVICTTEDDIKEGLAAILKDKIENHKKGQVNF